MADRSLKGTGLSSKTFESETGVEFEPRRTIEFTCPRAHHFTLVFAAEAEVPTGWTCPRCGVDAHRIHGQRPPATAGKVARTHWDMLRERRSLPELERLLAERLALLRAGRIGPSSEDYAASTASSADSRKPRRRSPGSSSPQRPPQSA